MPNSSVLRPTLFLDAGGVLVDDAVDPVFREHPGLEILYRNEKLGRFHGLTMRERLTARPGGEQEFYRWFREKTGRGDSDRELRRMLMENMKGLPAVARLRGWAEDGIRLGLLSNHAAQWLRPRLEELRVLDVFQEGLINISSDTQLLKADPAAFKHAFAGLPLGTIGFVDDKQKNVDGAELEGARGILADSDSHWIPVVDEWIQEVKDNIARGIVSPLPDASRPPSATFELP